MLIDNPNNLYTTWEVLASEEVKSIWGFAEHEKQKYNSDFDLYLGDLQNHALLQGYVQQCIEEKSWAWEIETGFINNNRTYNATVTPGGPSRNDPDYRAEYEKPSGIALLIGYLKALAAQRAIAECQWQHFKGDMVDVIGMGQHTSKNNFTEDEWDYFAFADLAFALEEDPSVTLSLNFYGEGKVDYVASFVDQDKDYGDRVFYTHAGKGWARKVDDFLGLVDGKHPESEGLLRFMTVAK
jgi:hypothetical protein